MNTLPTPSVDALPTFGIGDEVAVIPDCDDWASDWRDVRLWIAAIQALPGGGFDYWVSDAWPLPDKPALTDGFYMGAKDEPDTLSLVSRAALAASDRDVLVGENARLREALEPFAEVAAWAERNGRDLKDFDMILRGPGEQIAGHLQAQSEDFIHARAALVPLGGGAATLDSPRESSI